MVIGFKEFSHFMLVASILVILLSLAGKAVSADPRVSAAKGIIENGATGDPMQEGKGTFRFSGWGGKTIPVWSYVPKQALSSRLPIVIVMHGTRRDADRYRDEWSELAQENRFIVVAPRFSREQYPGSAGYNLGNVFSRADNSRNPEDIWSFSAIEPLFSAVVELLGSNQTEYTLYGHSAGSQFVHRFLYFKPEARVGRYIAANAGWYTMPDFGQSFPYGLDGSGIEEATVELALKKDVIVLLGTGDVDTKQRSLRRTAEAMLQGAHRFDRGKSFFRAAQRFAKEGNLPFNWQLVYVDNAVHSNRQMAMGAAAIIGGKTRVK